MSTQNWNATEYKKHASFVPTLANGVMELLSSRPGEKILDIGCGDGELTYLIQQKGCSVIGIDASSSMVESALKRGIKAHVADGHEINFNNEFDAVFSNATLHWLTEPDKVIEGVHRALKANGRFVGEFGGHGNVAAMLQAMREVFAENSAFGEFKSPWYFPTAKEYKRLLESSGFSVESIELIDRPTSLASGIEKWLEIFAEGITSHLNAKQKAVFIATVKRKLRANLFTENEGWIADYVRLRFKAIKR